MNTESMTRIEKYYFSVRKLNEGFKMYQIAKELEMTLDSLYVLRSDMKKEAGIIGTIESVIKMISFENFKEYLGNRPENFRNEYLLGQISGNKKPLRSNTLLILEGVREMLREYNN